jgi:hypothetical protein
LAACAIAALLAQYRTRLRERSRPSTAAAGQFDLLSDSCGQRLLRFEAARSKNFGPLTNGFLTS